LEGFTITNGYNDIKGGGIYIGGGCRPRINKCNLIKNRAFQGGGLYNVGGSISTNCTFSENYAGGVGGGVWNSGNSFLTNCIFSANSTYNLGGGIHNSGRNSVLTITNCTFASNSALSLYGGGIYNSDSKIIIINCIFWDNIPQWFVSSPGDSILSFNYIQGGQSNTGNINTDPLFADSDNGDYHLKSKEGRWDPINKIWVQDDVDSPCIDAGDPNSPVGEEPEPNGGRINMGAYGGTVVASKSP